MSADQRFSILPWHVDIAGLCLLAAIGAAAYTFLARPVLEWRGAARAQTVELAEKRHALDDLRASRRSTEQRLDDIRSELEHQTVKLEPRSHVNERLDRLTQLASDAGVTVERLAPGATTDSSRHGTMALRLTGQGPYAACTGFLAALHAAFNDTAITTLRLAGAPDQPDQPISIDLELLWFTAPDVKADAH